MLHIFSFNSNLLHLFQCFVCCEFIIKSRAIITFGRLYFVYYFIEFKFIKIVFITKKVLNSLKKQTNFFLVTNNISTKNVEIYWINPLLSLPSFSLTDHILLYFHSILHLHSTLGSTKNGKFKLFIDCVNIYFQWFNLMDGILDKGVGIFNNVEMIEWNWLTIKWMSGLWWWWNSFDS